MEATSVTRIKAGALEALLHHSKVHNPSPRKLQTQMMFDNNLKDSPRGLSMRVGHGHHGHGAATGCAAPSSGLVSVGLSEEDGKELVRLKEECCREAKGVEELLECLESEAIMGEDQGTEPRDYDRRAQIFDKSSKVFQALKNHSGNGSNNTDLNSNE